MPWSRPCRALCSTATLTILLACRSTVLAAGWERSERSERSTSCEAEMVSLCWADAADSVSCLSGSQSCSSTHSIFCRELHNAMSCSSNLVEDIECTFREESQRNYDSWIRGVEAVFTGLCVDGLLDELARGSCWSLEEARSCVQRRLGVQHVVDLLLKAPGGADGAGCHQSMAIVMSCWQQSHLDSSCEAHQETVERLLAAFFLLGCSDSDAAATGSSSFSTAAATVPNTRSTPTASWSSPGSRVRDAQRRPASPASGAAEGLRVRGRQVAVVALLLLCRTHLGMGCVGAPLLISIGL